MTFDLVIVAPPGGWDQNHLRCPERGDVRLDLGNEGLNGQGSVVMVTNQGQTK